jgi:arginine decarboxylase
MIIYKNFFIVKGKGEDNLSPINAFDKALMDAGIANQNLVPVSSILPEGAKELNCPSDLQPGEIVYCVLAKCTGKKGEAISAGLAYGLGKDDIKRYGIVMEGCDNAGSNNLKHKLELRIKEMAKIRNMELREFKIKIESIPEVKQKYGCVIVTLIYR